MAELEPADLFRYDRPFEGAFLDAVEVRNYLTALAQTHYGTDVAKPSNPRDGQPRVNAVDLNNIKWEVFLSGNWRTVLQQIDKGIAAPSKQIAQFTTPTTSWVIDHNLGSQVVAQVFDAAFSMLAPIGSALSPQELIFLGHVPEPVVTAFAGLQNLRTAIPMKFDGNVLRTFAVAAVAVPITGPPIGSIEFELSAGGGTMTGGLINLAAGAVLGAEIAGSTVTGNNNFSAGDTLQVRSNVVTAPVAGALDLYAEVERTVVGGGTYTLDQVTENRIIVTHTVPTAGFVVLVG